MELLILLIANHKFWLIFSWSLGYIKSSRKCIKFYCHKFLLILPWSLLDFVCVFKGEIVKQFDIDDMQVRNLQGNLRVCNIPFLPCVLLHGVVC